ncbi:HAD hydrolase family protein [Marine Group I thaumarchaeote]|uniref:HAD hydrolase family protein n=1 Tax=Marine Group I thaumarchaeote TaxID=2511932 RepID=A0A7K4MM19_9ARCH|nr:HAD hydrolase family protein [Marine Group I thaumarchaeote]
MSKSLLKKFQKIKLVLTDVDGVLTDGGMYYTKDGDIMKRFFVRDGMGVNLLKKQGIPTIIVTKEKNIVTKKWSDNMNIEKLYQGIIKKEDILEKVCRDYRNKSEEIAYIGDDINDLELLKRVGLSATPSDASSETIRLCDYTCKHRSGNGAFRELVDLILFTQNNKHEKIL